MDVVTSGVSFPISSNYIASLKKFKELQKIVVYVEGFEDVPFWSRLFNRVNVTVEVIAFGQCNKANGKGSIISAISNNNLVLGENLLVALDSDYDYLLDRNSNIFSNEFTFQTYVYSIENLIWRPEILGIICQTSCNNTSHINATEIKEGVKNWSIKIYPELLRYLSSGTSDEYSFNQIIESLNPQSLTNSYSSINFEDFLDSDFIEKMKKKGLKPDNAHLFIRGHNFADVVVKGCENIINATSIKVKDELNNLHKENAPQFIQEFFNKRCHPSHVAKGIDVECEFALPKILNDIEIFKINHCVNI